MKRGRVQLNLRSSGPGGPRTTANLVALASYRDQLKSLHGFDEQAIDSAQLSDAAGGRRGLPLARAGSPTEDWPEIAQVVVRGARPASKPSRPPKGGPWPPS